jgi:hypothetical protein
MVFAGAAAGASLSQSNESRKSKAQRHSAVAERRVTDWLARKAAAAECVRPDPSDYGTCFGLYVRACNKCADVCEHRYFSNLVITAIMTAFVLIGAGTYFDTTPKALVLIDNMVMCIFVVEIILKFFSNPLRPMSFFTGPERAWNIFDFIVTTVCLLPFGENAMILRMLRLCRVAKIIQQFPDLRVVVMGMTRGFETMVAICGLLFIDFYLYAVLGIVLFRANDRWHFESFPTAFITLFRMATLEDWTDVMYVVAVVMQQARCSSSHVAALVQRDGTTLVVLSQALIHSHCILPAYSHTLMPPITPSPATHHTPGTSITSAAKSSAAGCTPAIQRI